MNAIGDPATLLLRRLQRLLRWRVWIQEKLHPTDWQITLLWSALAGFLGALAALIFRGLAEDIYNLFSDSSLDIVEIMRRLPWWACILIPTAGGAVAGLILLLGRRIAPGQSSTDYMEAIAIGNGQIPIRSSLIKSASALFTIGTGGSIGREGPMVQLSSVLSSALGRWRNFTPPQLRLLVACGAAAGIASAYNAPIAGSFFVAEIILGTIAMESLGPLVVAAVVATLTVRVLTSAQTLYRVPAFQLNSVWEMGPYLILGLISGCVAPWFLRSLRGAEKLFVASKLPLIARLSLGGLIVGVIAIKIPQVCGNGYSVVVEILNGRLLWVPLVGIFIFKWVATASSFGSGAPGGVFTPSLFMGASAGYLFGEAVHAVWPEAAQDPRAFALVGMGAFLSAATRAPVMAIIMLFEMTLSYDIILPLMMSAVIAYYTAKGFVDRSLYSEVLQKKRAEAPASFTLEMTRVADLMKPRPPTILATARFAEIARMFLSERVNNLYVTEPKGKFLGVVSLHDIKPYLSEPDLAELVIARDILRDDFPHVTPGEPLAQALGGFLTFEGERLPVVESDGTLAGSLAKGDLLLALVERQKKPPVS